MNIRKLIDQTRDVYDDHEHTTTVMDALDYLEQLAKKEDEQRIKKAVYNATHSETEIREPYVSGYRAGWNDALRDIGMVSQHRAAHKEINHLQEQNKKLNDLLENMQTDVRKYLVPEDTQFSKDWLVSRLIWWLD